MNFKKGQVRTKNDIIKNYCNGKVVLDIGSVGQDIDVSSEAWVYNTIAENAASLTGCDTNFAGIQKLKEKGITILQPNDLDVDTQYDVVTMFDVIEHVDNIVDFINFYKKFAERGLIVITTPNPFNLRQFFNILFFGNPSVNPEHTTWIDPMNFLEISKRANLKIKEFYWLKEYTVSPKWYWNFVNIKIGLFRHFRRYFSANYCVILSRE